MILTRSVGIIFGPSCPGKLYYTEMGITIILLLLVVVVLFASEHIYDRPDVVCSGICHSLP